ncbi:hypothetical protein Bca52824_002452 [Brassica carinata]|uniref:Uncharacterized protein n=1 Tax=Brassica carinata TaxID=52824 RepID=A0A8X8BEV9_BRACI|nr:hypothetical protein Bca52824_002452 [Brassica carinata]
MLFFVAFVSVFEFFIRGDLFSVISESGNGNLVLDTLYERKGEMEDERADLLLNKIRGKFDWRNTEWPVLEHEETEMEEVHKKDIGSQADKSVDDTNFVSDEETSSVKVAGKGKRKSHDEGAETRKKKLLCKRSAEKSMILGPETKSFIEGLIHTSVTSLGVMLSTQMANMERMLTERMGKMESEVSQLRGAIRLSGEGSDPSKSEAEQDPLNSKGDQAPPKSLSDQAPPKSKDDQAPPKSKGNQPKGAKKMMRLLSLMDPYEWLHNLEIDAAMFVFRERTSLNRWKPYRVAFMTIVFSNMIKKEYTLLRGGRKKYSLHNLLVQYGRGVLPPRGATHEIWNLDGSIVCPCSR